MNTEIRGIQFSSLKYVPSNVYNLIMEQLSQIGTALEADPANVALRIRKALACLFIGEWETAFSEYCLIVILDTTGDKFNAERNILQAYMQHYVNTQKTSKGFDIHADFPMRIRTRPDYAEAECNCMEQGGTTEDDFIDEDTIDWDALNAFYGQTAEDGEKDIRPTIDNPV